MTEADSFFCCHLCLRDFLRLPNLLKHLKTGCVRKNFDTTQERIGNIIAKHYSQYITWDGKKPTINEKSYPCNFTPSGNLSVSTLLEYVSKSHFMQLIMPMPVVVSIIFIFIFFFNLSKQTQMHTFTPKLFACVFFQQGMFGSNNRTQHTMSFAVEMYLEECYNKKGMKHQQNSSQIRSQMENLFSCNQIPSLLQIKSWLSVRKKGGPPSNSGRLVLATNEARNFAIQNNIDLFEMQQQQETKQKINKNMVTLFLIVSFPQNFMKTKKNTVNEKRKEIKHQTQM